MLLFNTLPFVCGWLADRLLGDPPNWPHPIVWFGRAISAGEKKLNNGNHRKLKGSFLTALLVSGVYCICFYILKNSDIIDKRLTYLLTGIGVFYCLAGKTLRDEVKAVFDAVDRNRSEGRKQLARIVGRDTKNLNPQQIRTAALETLSENLSDGVIAPMFWFLILGLPGMMAYKMINTLDSMIGYKNERYIDFGYTAAKLDDVTNYIPARLTSFLLLLVSGNLTKIKQTCYHGKMHASPNSGYPEAALAMILDCRFGGPNMYFGRLVDKPYIGNNERTLTTKDMEEAIRYCSISELWMGIITICILIQIK